MQRLAGIQVLRGVAALSVVLCHLVTMRFGMGIDTKVAFATSSILRHGVDIFFVISGFVIALTADHIGKSRGRAGAPGFAWRRFIRIFPLYWIALAAALISSRWITLSGWPGLPQTLTLDYVLLTTAGNWFVPPAWSLHYELWFYSALVVIMLIAPGRTLVLLVACVCALILYDITFWPAPTAVIFDAMTLEFGFGVIVALLVKRGVIGAGWTSLLLAATFLGAGIWLASGAYVSGFQRAATFGVGSAFLIYAVVVLENGGMTFAIPLRYLGDMSYSLYIWHYLILTWLVLFNPPWPGPLQLLMWLVAILLVSAASYEWLERPILRWSHKPASARGGLEAIHTP